MPQSLVTYWTEFEVTKCGDVCSQQTVICTDFLSDFTLLSVTGCERGFDSERFRDILLSFSRLPRLKRKEKPGSYVIDCCSENLLNPLVH